MSGSGTAGSRTHDLAVVSPTLTIRLPKMKSAEKPELVSKFPSAGINAVPDFISKDRPSLGAGWPQVLESP